MAVLIRRVHVSVLPETIKMFDCSLGRSVARSLGRSVACSLTRSLGRSLGRSVARSLARSPGRSIAHSVGGASPTGTNPLEYGFGGGHLMLKLVFVEYASGGVPGLGG